MSILDHLANLIAPYNCLGCGSESGMVCKTCACLLVSLKPYCYRCKKPTQRQARCQNCTSTSHLHAVYAAADYSDLAKRLVWKCKFGRALSAAQYMATAMAVLLKDVPSHVTLVPAPTASRRARQRGYDQSVLLAKALSCKSHLRYATVLARNGQAHQVGASRAVRRQQLQTAFRVRSPHKVAGKSIILIDDVLTTGATLEAAAKALHDAGAAQIIGLVFAQA